MEASETAWRQWTASASSWSNSGDLYVSGLRAKLSITAGGSVSDNNGFIASSGGTMTGAVNVSGSGSTWINRANLFVGGSSGAACSGTLSIIAGGSVSDMIGYIAAASIYGRSHDHRRRLDMDKHRHALCG